MNDEKKQKIINKLYVDAVLNEEPEKLTEPYEIDQVAHDNYQKALMLLATLKGQGKCDFTYDSLHQPYILHCINVVWKTDKNGYLELNSKEIATILENMDGIVLDAQLENEWQLSSTIYHEI